MTHEERSRRATRAEREVLVISRIPEGFRVYSPSDPRRTYTVAEGEERLTCSCPDFEQHAADPDWHCKHVIAVERYGNEAGTQPPPASAPTAPMPVSMPAQMHIKRSVSPDGRIDSLSVAVSWPVEGIPADEMKRRIEGVLKLQSEVVERFLGKPAEEPPQTTSEDASSQAAPARMVAVGGMDGRWGRRLFLTFDVEGRHVRLFGTQKRLAEAMAQAGYSRTTESIAEGLELGLPCRVVTKPTPDGRYVNVEQVLPPTTTGPRR